MARDDVIRVQIVPELVVKARGEVMAYLQKFGVYRVVPRAHQMTIGGQVIGTRWVDTNKAIRKIRVAFLDS